MGNSLGEACRRGNRKLFRQPSSDHFLDLHDWWIHWHLRERFPGRRLTSACGDCPGLDLLLFDAWKLQSHPLSLLLSLGWLDVRNDLDHGRRCCSFRSRSEDDDRAQYPTVHASWNRCWWYVRDREYYWPGTRSLAFWKTLRHRNDPCWPVDHYYVLYQCTCVLLRWIYISWGSQQLLLLCMCHGFVPLRFSANHILSVYGLGLETHAQQERRLLRLLQMSRRQPGMLLWEITLWEVGQVLRPL